MAAIGPYTVQQFVGTMPRPRRPFLRLPPYPGVNNCILIRGQQRIPQGVIRTAVQQNTRAGVQSLLQSYLNLIGTVVVVVDQFGVAFQQVTVLDVDPIPSDLIVGARLDAIWQLDVPYL